MSIGPSTAKELVKLGANIEVRNGLGPSTLKEIVKIAKKSGSRVSVSSNCIGPSTAKELAKTGGSLVTIIIE